MKSDHLHLKISKSIDKKTNSKVEKTPNSKTSKTPKHAAKSKLSEKIPIMKAGMKKANSQAVPKMPPKQRKTAVEVYKMPNSLLLKDTEGKEKIESASAEEKSVKSGCSKSSKAKEFQKKLEVLVGEEIN